MPQWPHQTMNSVPYDWTVGLIVVIDSLYCVRNVDHSYMRRGTCPTILYVCPIKTQSSLHPCKQTRVFVVRSMESYWLKMRTAKTVIRLNRITAWSESSLGERVKLQELLCLGSYVLHQGNLYFRTICGKWRLRFPLKWSLNEPAHDKTNKIASAPSED